MTFVPRTPTAAPPQLVREPPPVQRARRPCFTLGRGTVGRLLAVPARLLHPWRRRAARETLRTRALRSILVVCHGNICRSPVAAALLRQEIGRASCRERV